MKYSFTTAALAFAVCSFAAPFAAPAITGLPSLGPLASSLGSAGDAGISELGVIASSALKHIATALPTATNTALIPLATELEAAASAGLSVGLADLASLNNAIASGLGRLPAKRGLASDLDSAASSGISELGALATQVISGLESLNTALPIPTQVASLLHEIETDLGNLASTGLTDLSSLSSNLTEKAKREAAGSLPSGLGSAASAGISDLGALATKIVDSLESLNTRLPIPTAAATLISNLEAELGQLAGTGLSDLDSLASSINSKRQINSAASAGINDLGALATKIADGLESINTIVPIPTAAATLISNLEAELAQLAGTGLDDLSSHLKEKRQIGAAASSGINDLGAVATKVIDGLESLNTALPLPTQVSSLLQELGSKLGQAASTGLGDLSSASGNLKRSDVGTAASAGVNELGAIATKVVSDLESLNTALPLPTQVSSLLQELGSKLGQAASTGLGDLSSASGNLKRAAIPVADIIPLAAKILGSLQILKSSSSVSLPAELLSLIRDLEAKILTIF